MNGKMLWPVAASSSSVCARAMTLSMLVPMWLLCGAVAALSAEEAQDWRLQNTDFNWQQEAETHVQILGRGVEDRDGNLYFVGTKTYNDDVNDQNLFVARVNADDSLGWTREFGTTETDGGTALTLVRNVTTDTETLYVVGWTWGYMDDFGHALNGFGRFGGRDVVLLKLTLDGHRVWSRQFGTTADDFGYGVQLDGAFDVLLLTGGCGSDQTDTVMEMEVDAVTVETRQSYSPLERQLMDPFARTGVDMRQFQFAVSLNAQGDILDYTMDGGVTVTSRRQRIKENGSAVGEYVVVLNRQPLEDVTIHATIVRFNDPRDEPVQQLRFVSDPTSTQHTLTFTTSNWNREQLVRVVAEDDAIAEGMHYATITHVSSSGDPNFDGENTPFLYGRNFTLQIQDNDIAGIQFSRRHVFAAEGGVNDSYTAVLQSKPWYPVDVIITSLHETQVTTYPSVLTFNHLNWNVPQVVNVVAVDDTRSEVEYGGLYFGGRLLHYSVSKDLRYHTRQPQCFDLPRCDPANSSDCLDSQDPVVRVCDIMMDCDGRLGNGACIVHVSDAQSVPARFGTASLDPSIDAAEITEPPLSYTELKSVIQEQALDRNLSMGLVDLTPFTPPPPDLRSFVLSFLGLLNLNQLQALHRDYARSVHAFCQGLVRLDTQRWAFDEWPEGYVTRVLNATRAIFDGAVQERHVWNCGLATFRSPSGRPANAINVSLWDNDPGVTLSKPLLTLHEGSYVDTTYSIVLNAPPSRSASPSLRASFCTQKASDRCGLWTDFESLAQSIYTVESPVNVSIAVIGNAQLVISPSFVTFSNANWFVPQWISVRALDDPIAEASNDELANFTISHRVQASTFGYDDSTAFWFRDTSPSMASQFPMWRNDDAASMIPYNVLPTLLYAPSHRKIKAAISDNDRAGVRVRVPQPRGRIKTHESDDRVDWVGDAVTTLAFSDLSLRGASSISTGSSVDMGTALQNVLVFETNATTFLKFHLPDAHEGDTHAAFGFAQLLVHETPFKVFNASESEGDSGSSGAAASSGGASFEKSYRLRITVVNNAWTDAGVRKGTDDPAAVTFLPETSIERIATITKKRSALIDVTPLVQSLLPMRLPVVSFKIQVLSDVVVTNNSSESDPLPSGTTQLCSSLFARALRPMLVIGYSFPNRLVEGVAKQISITGSQGAALAIDGERGIDSSAASTADQPEAWWQVTLPRVRRLGTVAITLPDVMNSDDVDNPTTLVAVASLLPLDPDNSELAALTKAKTVGCPDNCPVVERLVARKSLVLWELNAGVRTLRLYREDPGMLSLVEVEAFDPFLKVTPTANGQGMRARLHSDWLGDSRSDSWRLQQSIRQSKDENLARGMFTQQSSTSPSDAVSALAVNGQRASAWDPLAVDSVSLSMVAGSTRTQKTDNPWWLVDLGAVEPIGSIELFPYIGLHGRGLCQSSASVVPSWTGDLATSSTYDELLELHDPFEQTFQVIVTTEDGVNAPVVTQKTLVFSCEGGVKSIAWRGVFALGRFVRVIRQATNAILMLNEVEVRRWNPATTPQFLLLDLRGEGDTPLALSSIQLFAPTDDENAAGGFAVPISYTIHSVSSQRALSGAGSALALMDASRTSECYIANRASYREWIVLKLATPTRVGLVDVQTNVDACGVGVSPVFAMTISARGATLEGLRTSQAQAAAATTLSSDCFLNASALVLNPSASATCSLSGYVCGETVSCHAERTTTANSELLVMSDFNDLMAMGVPSLVPLTRLPLSQSEHRSFMLRDIPVILWMFDDQPTKTLYDADASSLGVNRRVSSVTLTDIATTKTLNIDDTLEQTYFSNAVAVQPAMSAFTIEFWLLFTEAPLTRTSTTTLVTLASDVGVMADLSFTDDTPYGAFTLRDPDSDASCVSSFTKEIGGSAINRWFHIAASYDPSAAQITLSVRTETGFLAMDQLWVTKPCNLPILSRQRKRLQFGAVPRSDRSGFIGRFASVAWYVKALEESVLLDHFHEFLRSNALLHNAYALSLTTQPATPVRIEINVEQECYRFTLCNVTALPRIVTFTPENWAEPQYIRVLATEDELYESLIHPTTILHVATSAETYQVQSVASTLALSADTRWEDLYSGAVKNYDRDRVYWRTFHAMSEAIQVQMVEELSELHVNWSRQDVEEMIVASDPYNASMAIVNVGIEIIDATIPGIQFSTSSLIVSEAGKGNDYQILLLSEPTSDVKIVLNAQTDCYRACVPAPVCLSQRNEEDSSLDAALRCGDALSAQPNQLCNITVSPNVLVFTPLNWRSPQNVRVLAVDDQLDEADIHLTTIQATSFSADPIYDNVFLPDIVVAVEDNDVTAVAYSTLALAVGEKVDSKTYYELTLETEPWANVTIAMTNELPKGACYRPCGYHFDNATCGLPRQQSVSSVVLATDSPREIHEITLSLPRVTEVQRVVTYSEHVDQIYRVRLIGGVVHETYAIEFRFSDPFRVRFPSADAIAMAVNYGKTFRITAKGGSGAPPKATTASIDGFASATVVDTALNALWGSKTVNVTRELAYTQSVLRWQITFARVLSLDGVFPTLSVTVDAPFEGTLTAQRVAMMVPPTGSFQLSYGAAKTVDIPFDSKETEIEGYLRDLDGVYAVSVTQRLMSVNIYGVQYRVAFLSVESYETLQVSTTGMIKAIGATTNIIGRVFLEQAPVMMGGSFVLQYTNDWNTTRTPPIPSDADATTIQEALGYLDGLGNVSVTAQRRSAEGSKEWTIDFYENTGDLRELKVVSMDLIGKNVVILVDTVRDGVSLGGFFFIELGGLFKKTNTHTKRVYLQELPHKNTTAVAWSATSDDVSLAIDALGMTESVEVSRDGLNCDAFDICTGYTWRITYANSPGNLPPITVYGKQTLTGDGVTLGASTIANGTYLSGMFSLILELYDPEHPNLLISSGRTWSLPVNVSSYGMDQALEALPFMRSNREQEYDPVSRRSRGIKFDKGVRVSREGPFLDGGHSWRLEWAIEDYVRFQNLKIIINTTLVTQEIEPFAVPSELDLDGAPRCASIPHARFELDKTDLFGLRGTCVYDLVNVTTQERFLCNFTVGTPWLVFTPENWCLPQRVEISAVDDFLDESTIDRANTTLSSVTHTVFSDDMIYAVLPLEQIEVAVDSDDVARVIVSETHLDVSEDGLVVADYQLQLATEPLYDVRIVVLPWLDAKNTQCYRFKLCNLTIPTSEFVFTPRDWDLPQRVVVQATDDSLDEADLHDTGISHVAFSTDPKYHKISIPTIHVTVKDNDMSGFVVDKTTAFTTEGGATDSYNIVLTTEPFAKVTVDIKNVATTGNFVKATPSQLVFTWLNWNIPQRVDVAAVNDDTQDVIGSSSVLVHTLSTNDAIYAALRNLGSLLVYITDNDVAGIQLSTLQMDVAERSDPYVYSVRLTSEPWDAVVLTPNAAHDCYLRPQTNGVRVCNATILTTTLYFGAANWSQWQHVSFLAFDDSLQEAPVHTARITHSTTSKIDSDYVFTDAQATPKTTLMLSITDNDISYVTISLIRGLVTTPRTRLHVAEGGFNDSYSIVLNSEPYEDVLVSVRPAIEAIRNLDDLNLLLSAPQVGAAYQDKSTLGIRTSDPTTLVNDLQLVFSPLDWSQPRVITVFAIDDQIPEDPTQFSSLSHAVVSADPQYNISNSSLGIVDVAVMINDREVIPPPVPVSAMFDANGARVIVTFDSIVYHAVTMTPRPMSASSSLATLYTPKFKTFACDLVFSFTKARYVLGTGVVCLWSDAQRLRIDLGPGATLTANDVLVLNECAPSEFVNQTCQSQRVLRARYTSRAYTQATMAVTLPSDIVQPHIVMATPDEAGSCGVWSADATLSTGAGGRPYSLVVWRILPASLLVAGTSLADAEIVLQRAKALSDGPLTSLCTKYADPAVTTLVKADVVTSGGDALASLLTTLTQLRATCYVRSLAQAATTAKGFRVSVDSSLLEPGARYLVAMRLGNAFAQRTTAVRTVRVQALPGPSVVVLGDAVIEASRVGDPLVFQVNATLSCPQLTPNARVAYHWTAVSYSTASSSLSDAVAVDLNATNTAKDPRVFRVPRTQLVAGRTYRFRMETSLVDSTTSKPLTTSSSSSSTVIVVTVLNSPLRPVITGGERALGERDTVVLSGATSVDPDVLGTESTSSLLPLTYLWLCEDITNTTQPCINATASTSDRYVPLSLPTTPSTASQLLLTPFTLLPLRTLRFSLVLSRGTRTATTSTTVYTRQGSLPIVAVNVSATKINPSSRVMLNAVVSSTYPYTARWLEDQGDLGLPEPSDTINITRNDAFVMPLTSVNNSIRRNALTPGQMYIFRLQATDLNGNVGFGTVRLQVNAPPSSGLFQVTPHVGYALQDYFTLECAQWTDDSDDLPLTYAFGVLSSTQFVNISSNITLVRQQMRPLVPEQLAPNARVTFFPPDGLKESEDVTVIAFISDRMGAMTMVSDAIRVLLPPQAKSQPVVFVSNLLAQKRGSQDMSGSTDSTQTTKYLLSAALIMGRAVKGDAGLTGCPGAGSDTGVCSGHGLCDTATLVCGCDSGYMGQNCELEVAAVSAVNDEILSTLSTTAKTTEPTESGLAQQAQVVDTVVSLSSAAFDNDNVGTVTSTGIHIAQDAKSLADPGDFVETTGATLVNALSTVLTVRSMPGKAASKNRRLSSEQWSLTRELEEAIADPMSDESFCASARESSAAQASYKQLLQTLQALSMLSGQDLLEDEPPAMLSAGQITVYTSPGNTLQVGSPGLDLKLTPTALVCLQDKMDELVMSAFVLTATTHPQCTLNESTALSAAMVVTVQAKSASSVVMLTGSSDCVVKANKQAQTQRRLASATASDSVTWSPLVVVTVPHARVLTLVEQRNFTTGCRTWNAVTGQYETEVCYKDETLSTFEYTVCYCSELGTLEVIATLEERLDYYSHVRDLYRNDSSSLIGSITLSIIWGLFVLGGRVGQRVDAIDRQKEKEKTVKNLNRSKWSELQERTEKLGVLEDFASFLARRKQEQNKKDAVAMTAVTATTVNTSSTMLLASSDSQIPVAAPVEIQTLPDDDVVLPNEVRTLFASNARLHWHYTTLTTLFRLCNGTLVLLGLVMALVGLDFWLVLGNSTSEQLVLFLYGTPIGIVLLVLGSIVLVLGINGVVLARDAASPRSRRTYATLLLLVFLAQLVCAFVAFRYLSDFDSLPVETQALLRHVWDTLGDHVQAEVQTFYGCCGFSSIADAAECPEEALDASPPRTCFAVVAQHAEELFSTSFLYLQGVMIVQTAAWLLIQVILHWRALRLAQLAGQPANNVTGETSAERFMLRSLLDIVLHALLPSLLQLESVVMAVLVFFGVDLVAQLHILSNALAAAFFGIEMGVVTVVLGVIAFLVVLLGQRALCHRDARSLQWFLALSVATGFAFIGLFIFVARTRVNLALDPALIEWIHTKYTGLSQETRVTIETAMVCCGFTSHSEGACVADVQTDHSTLPTCRLLIQDAITRELTYFQWRLLVLLGFQGLVLLLTTVVVIRMRRFAVKPRIQPTTVVSTKRPPLPKTFRAVLFHHVCFFVTVSLSLAGVVLGLVVICAGLDAIYQLNVLHLSYLLRIFDRQVGVYLLATGGVLEVLAWLSLVIAWRPHASKRLAWVFVLVMAALFTALFGVVGVSYRVAHVPFASPSAFHSRLETLWIATPSNTRIFLQNALDCCGFDKIASQNASPSNYTYAAELPAWRYASSDQASVVVVDTSGQQRTRRLSSVSLPRARRLTQVVCPVSASDGCAAPLAQYAQRVGSSSFRLVLGVLVSLVVLLLAVGGLVLMPSLTLTWHVLLPRFILTLSCIAALLVSLCALFLGLDILSQWSLFTSSALQIVFALSIGIAFLAYSAYTLVLNAYALQGLCNHALHRLVLQAAARVPLTLGCWLGVALTAAYSRYSESSSWLEQLASLLDHQWNTLSSTQQRHISVDFDCCGFQDPVVVKGRGIVFDRPALGYTCALAAARGCQYPLTAQLSGSFAWLFQFLLALALFEMLVMCLTWLVLKDLRRHKPHDWFVIESRVRYAVGTYRSNLHRHHVILSLYKRFDPKLARSQRLTSVLCALVTSLAVYSAWFAHNGCHRHALKTCEQPDVWSYLGMGLLYGGVVGFATQTLIRALFEAVRHRSDDETKEVAVARQRKEKMLLFRRLFQRQRPTSPSLSNAAVTNVSLSSSTLEMTHATTEERWFTWLSRFLHGAYAVVACILFVLGIGIATFMALVLLGVQRTLYGVDFVKGPSESLVLALLITGTSLVAWLALDLKQRQRTRSPMLFALVAIVSVLLLVLLWLGVYMASQTLDEDSTNWTIRNTGFSVPERLTKAWRVDGTPFFRSRVQQELQCCGFTDATDTAYRPCPEGTLIQLDLEATRVNGTVVSKELQQLQDLDGCYLKMLARFHTVVEGVVAFAATISVLQILLIASALFLAYDVSISKDAKLKLRVVTTTTSSSATQQQQVQVRETFEKVVGLKIAAPARGKILAKMLSSSLESVSPSVATELAATALVTDVHDPVKPDGASSDSTVPAGRLHLPDGRLVSAALATNDLALVTRVPYPAWIVYVVYGICAVWLGVMSYLIVINSLELGRTTAWRCIAAWAVGLGFHLLLIEPFVVFVGIIWKTLGAWWTATPLGRLVRFGRRVLRIQPNAAAVAASYYASLSLYERIRYNAAVRIQRRLLTRLARHRYLKRIRQIREAAHRALAAKRRLTLKQAIEGFSEEEIDAFRLLFQDADTARLGLVSYQVISQSIYQLGVNVAPEIVHGFLLELDPAYADLVDFEHFLYGMHRVRLHHQQEQVALDELKAQIVDEHTASTVTRLKEELVSSSSRFGPQADPQSRVFVKRQNLLRELREKRESLSYKLMSKVGRLPPILQRAKSSSDAAEQEAKEGVPSQCVARAGSDEATPTGAYVLLQNRKLSPKKRTLEMILKKKSREDKALKTPSNTTGGSVSSPRSPKQRAKDMMQGLHLHLPGSPRAKTLPPEVTVPESKASPLIPVIHEETEEEEVLETKPKVELSETEATEVSEAIEVSSAEVSGQVQGADSVEEDTATEKQEEARPFGTFMLLAKQTPNAGKNKVMEMIQQKQSETLRKVSGDPDEEKTEAKTQDEEHPPAKTEVRRPTTAEKKENAKSIAKGSLEKALKKKSEAAKPLRSPKKRG